MQTHSQQIGPYPRGYQHTRGLDSVLAKQHGSHDRVSIGANAAARRRQGTYLARYSSLACLLDSLPQLR